MAGAGRATDDDALLDIRGLKTHFVTDDGIATGSTMIAALHAIRAQGPRELIVAVPVASPERLVEIRRHCDDVVCLLAPERFSAVGQFYRDFTPVEDEEAIAIYHDTATWSSANSVTGPFPGFPVPLEGDDVTDLIEQHRDELPFSDQLPTFDPPKHTDHRGLLMRLFSNHVAREVAEAIWDQRDEFLDGVLKGICGGQRTVMFSSHQLDEVNRLADSVAIMNAGRILIHSPLEELLRSTKRVRAVLENGRLPQAISDGIDVRRRIGFEVLPPSGDVKRTTVTALKEKGGRITLSKDLVADLIPGRTRITLGVGPAAALDVPGLLSALDRYPYGCAEQTVSRALPLLYANEVASTIGLGADKEIRARVQGAIDRVFEMQDASGAFGIWGPSSADIWLTGYVMDFLTRAKEQGYQIASRPFAQGLDRLQNYLSYAQDFEKGGEARAYALYVLARNARAPMGELRYYADTRVDRFGSALAKAQLGAALSLAGDKERAASVFRAALKHMDDTAKEAVIARADYGSGLRDGAALVTLAAETGLAKMETPRLATVVAKAYQTRTHTSTQEQAWMLLAAKALGDQARETRLTVGGKAHTGALVRTLSAAELAQGLTVANDGEAPVDAVLTVIGASLTPEPAAAKGFKIERTAYTLDGKKLDLKSLAGGVSEIRQNDRLVVVLKIEAKETGGRLLLVDRLPAGLEIENPRLVEGGDIKSLDWLKTSVKPEHTEFRDDRFVAAFNFFGAGVRQEAASIEGPEDDGDGDPAATADAARPKGPVSTASVAYVVRAVTPGSFVHPAATIEDMYRPERHARSASGRLVVKE